MPPLLREIHRCLYQHGSPAPSRPFRPVPKPFGCAVSLIFCLFRT